MEPEKEIVSNGLPDDSDNVTDLEMLEPQTELGLELVALAKEIDKSGIPKLTLEEIEEYLGRELGGIAEALGA